MATNAEAFSTTSRRKLREPKCTAHNPAMPRSIKERYSRWKEESQNREGVVILSVMTQSGESDIQYLTNRRQISPNIVRWLRTRIYQGSLTL
jgi:hypothetical protein